MRERKGKAELIKVFVDREVRLMVRERPKVKFVGRQRNILDKVP